MKKIALCISLLSLTACAFPSTPRDNDLLHATHQFQPELFTSGARGQVILSMSDNVSKMGFVGDSYTDGIVFKNIRSGEEFSLVAPKGKNEYGVAMLPVGEYVVTNLYLRYTYDISGQIGGPTLTAVQITTDDHANAPKVRIGTGLGSDNVTMTDTITDDHYEGDKKIRFMVKPGVVTYIGHIDLERSGNLFAGKTSGRTRSFRISDKSNDIPARQQKKWRKKFGTDYVVDIATVQ